MARNERCFNVLVSDQPEDYSMDARFLQPKVCAPTTGRRSKMAAEQKEAAREKIATVVATAAVTLAVGVTAAALGGYLVPGGIGAKAPRAEVTPPTPPNVVLVPVAPDSPSEPVMAQPGPEVMLA